MERAEKEPFEIKGWAIVGPNEGGDELASKLGRLTEEGSVGFYRVTKTGKGGEERSFLVVGTGGWTEDSLLALRKGYRIEDVGLCRVTKLREGWEVTFSGGPPSITGRQRRGTADYMRDRFLEGGLSGVIKGISPNQSPEESDQSKGKPKWLRFF